ncbi:hypothetical protein ABB37_09081 [Leptomonas pyrrhocoris]|uniref:CTLH domain-containing protein n=1 Tax=Leptomonas pyrrhocoris TaxID=157538 RepID=A0A0M9FRX0_LEPPY|nr:hypothetical protein ABB37_09081 [Leptomonas pyrrhocoris]KPA74805.1 hypothetical protein ABB37_09081 [Leptomonas pyrrhocoris]|eukprot:XP_015653244.1 hypothetical protein ABB37_09081 [Leptomonas pyrrhocoris]
MELTEKAMWVLIEEAVIQDRGEDEEEVLAQMVRSYLARRGLADTLHTFDEEQRAFCGVSRALPVSRTTSAKAADECAAEKDAAMVSGSSAPLAASSGHEEHEIDRRKSAQLLCLQERFDAAAALMPPTSLARIRLLCIQARHLTDIGDAVLFLASNVAPLIPFCVNPVLGHEVYTSTLNSVLSPHRKPLQLDTEALAKEVNDELCGEGHPSSLDILFNWAYWQETSA